MKTLLIVDMQNDFMPGGSLGVPKGDQLISYINQIQANFELVIASKDWHPKGHASFASASPTGKWPDHCIQKSWGAEFPDFLDTRRFSRVFYKGNDPNGDSLSAFYEVEGGHSTGLAEYLHEKGVTKLTVVGVATDYCVKQTVLDACHLGFEPSVLVEGCRAIANSEPALQAMKEAGATLI